MRQHGHPVATFDTEPGAQTGSQAPDAIVEFRVGEYPAGCEVFHGDAIAARRCVVGYPVICRYRHDRLPGVNRRYSLSASASPQDL